MFAFIVAAAMLGQCNSEELPFVWESYDCVMLVHEKAESRHWDADRLYFVRDGKVVADRLWSDDMLMAMHQGCFSITWCDYCNCHRQVEFARLEEYCIDLDDTEMGTMVWFGMARRMTDLKAP